MKILCKFDRIGGMTGKRIHIYRVATILIDSETCLTFLYKSKCDVLSVANDKIYLDKFMKLSLNQNATPENTKIYNTLYKYSLGIIDFNGGYVTDIQLIQLDDFVKANLKLFRCNETHNLNMGEFTEILLNNYYEYILD